MTATITFGSDVLSYSKSCYTIGIVVEINIRILVVNNHFPMYNLLQVVWNFSYGIILATY